MLAEFGRNDPPERVFPDENLSVTPQFLGHGKGQIVIFISLVDIHDNAVTTYLKSLAERRHRYSVFTPCPVFNTQRRIES